ncbi:TPA: glycosyltransferase family 2 protein [Raoultella planticola]
MNALIIVVIYNKKIQSSQTLNSLLHTFATDSHLLIFNNGPESLELDDDIYKSLKDKFNNNIFIQEDLSNRPLSVLYNYAINEHKGYSYYCLFDDDTNIPVDYFSEIETARKQYPVDLMLPVIRSVSDDTVHYPLINGKPTDIKGIVSSDNIVFSIGSGLVIFDSLIKSFKSNNIKLFDERYAFYGVDFSLFRRIRVIQKNGCSVNISVVSSLSHSLAKTKKVKENWRKCEITIDQALTTKFYGKTQFGILFVIAKKILKLDFKNALLALKTYSTGCHPRSQKYM